MLRPGTHTHQHRRRHNAHIPRERRRRGGGLGERKCATASRSACVCTVLVRPLASSLARRKSCARLLRVDSAGLCVRASERAQRNAFDECCGGGGGAAGAAAGVCAAAACCLCGPSLKFAVFVYCEWQPLRSAIRPIRSANCEHILGRPNQIHYTHTHTYPVRNYTSIRSSPTKGRPLWPPISIIIIRIFVVSTRRTLESRRNSRGKAKRPDERRLAATVRSSYCQMQFF
jgi:hypothetical protein